MLNSILSNSLNFLGAIISLIAVVVGTKNNDIATVAIGILGLIVFITPTLANKRILKKLFRKKPY